MPLTLRPLDASEGAEDAPSRAPQSYLRYLLRITVAVYVGLHGRCAVLPLWPKESVVKRSRLTVVPLLAVALGTSLGETSNAQPMDRCQFTAWLAGGISNHRLARL